MTILATKETAMPNNQVAMAELASEMWEMEPRRLAAFMAGLAENNIQHNSSNDPILDTLPSGWVREIKTGDTMDFVMYTKQQAKVPAPTQSGGVAIIPINGILMNNVPKWFAWFDIEATAYGDIISMVKAAAMSDDVERIHLQINSPGGTVAGVHEASQAIFNARKTKQVTAHINDLGASAAYHLAAQAQAISVGPNAEVGSIGVFSVYVDSSKAAEDEGIKVHVIRSGDHKGMGVPGDKITAEQLASQQAVVDGMADNFVKAVATGRDMKVSDIRKLATGETWIAKTAKSNGLIDSVVGASKSNNNNSKEAKEMADTKEGLEKEWQQLAAEKSVFESEKIQFDLTKEAVAKEAVTEDRERLAALQAEFDDDLEFAVEQFTKGASLIEAKAAYSDVLKERLAESKKNQPKPEQKKVGAKAIEHSEGGEQNADDFLTQAHAMAKELGIKNSEAIERLKKEDPDLFARSQNR